MTSLADYADKALLAYTEFLNMSPRDDGSQFRKSFSTIPSSIKLIFPAEAFTDPPLFPTERLILLVLMADRAQSSLVKVISTFDQVANPLLMNTLLEPFVNNDISQYSDTYTQIPIPPGLNIFQGIKAMGNLRIKQNLILRDALRVRYVLIEVISDPFTYTSESLRDIGSLVAKCEIAIQTDPIISSHLKVPIDNLRRNFEVIKNHLGYGATLSQDIIRRLKLLLGVFEDTTGTSSQEDQEKKFLLSSRSGSSGGVSK